MIPKFRAFYKANQKMYEVLTLDIIDKKAFVENNDDPGKPLRGYANISEIELMQSTGLYDKNGKEIFEGDILHWKDCEPVDDEMVYEDIIVVYWSDEFMMWKAKNEDTDYIDLYDYSDNRELEVLGNIYETPELLEEVEE